MSTSFNQKYKAQEVQELKNFFSKKKKKKKKSVEKRKDDWTLGKKIKKIMIISKKAKSKDKHINKFFIKKTHIHTQKGMITW